VSDFWCRQQHGHGASIGEFDQLDPYVTPRGPVFLRSKTGPKNVRVQLIELPYRGSRSEAIAENMAILSKAETVLHQLW
jgi:hypothetical protein